MSEPITPLHEEHTPEAIAERIEAATRHSHLGDFVLGAVDGTITTFAIVAGVAGAGEYIGGGVGVALLLGLANVLADGLSMAASNYLKARSDRAIVDRFRRMEERHIDEIPEGERDEIRQIFAGKGFEGGILEEIVRVITNDRRRWVDTMLTEEWGLPLDSPNPTKAAAATFFGFLLAGLTPILPLLLGVLGFPLAPQTVFLLSAAVAGVTFTLIGVFRGMVLHQRVWKSALETFAIGAGAAAVAYLVGNVLAGWLLG